MKKLTKYLLTAVCILALIAPQCVTASAYPGCMPNSSITSGLLDTLREKSYDFTDAFMNFETAQADGILNENGINAMYDVLMELDQNMNFVIRCFGDPLGIPSDYLKPGADLSAYTPSQSHAPGVPHDSDLVHDVYNRYNIPKGPSSPSDLSLPGSLYSHNAVGLTVVIGVLCFLAGAGIVWMILGRKSKKLRKSDPSA